MAEAEGSIRVHLKFHQISHQSLSCADFTAPNLPPSLHPPHPVLIVPQILLKPAGQRGISYPCSLGVLVSHDWMEVAHFYLRGHTSGILFPVYHVKTHRQL